MRITHLIKEMEKTPYYQEQESHLLTLQHLRDLLSERKNHPLKLIQSLLPKNSKESFLEGWEELKGQ